MEDAHICNTTLPNGLTLFAVFDGHGGKKLKGKAKSLFGRSSDSSLC